MNGSWIWPYSNNCAKSGELHRWIYLHPLCHTTYLTICHGNRIQGQDASQIILGSNICICFPFLYGNAKGPKDEGTWRSKNSVNNNTIMAVSMMVPLILTIISELTNFTLLDLGPSKEPIQKIPPFSSWNITQTSGMNHLKKKTHMQKENRDWLSTLSQTLTAKIPCTLRIGWDKIQLLHCTKNKVFH